MRRGTSLVEMLILISVILPVAGSALALAYRLTRLPPPPDGRSADLSCMRLRQDAREGLHRDGAALIAGSHRWEVVDGWWCRDATQRLRVRDVAIVANEGRVRIQLRMPDLPDRILDLAEAP